VHAELLPDYRKECAFLAHCVAYLTPSSCS